MQHFYLSVRCSRVPKLSTDFKCVPLSGSKLHLERHGNLLRVSFILERGSRSFVSLNTFADDNRVTEVTR